MTKQPLRWAIIHVTMLSSQLLDESMNIVNKFEERHGGKPYLYFARYTEDSTIRITILTRKTDKELKQLFRRLHLGIFKVKAETKGGGSWEHSHMYQVAKHVFGKKPGDIQDVVHWLYNMCNYNYLQESACHVNLAAQFLGSIVRPPNYENKSQEIPTPAKPPAKGKSRKS